MHTTTPVTLSALPAASPNSLQWRRGIGKARLMAVMSSSSPYAAVQLAHPGHDENRTAAGGTPRDNRRYDLINTDHPAAF